MSYSIDLYRGKIPVERSLLRFATFVAFFPQLVAGPIVRASVLLPQFQKDKPFEWERVTSGLSLMLLGYFKKVVVADSLAGVVERTFLAPEAHTSLSLLLGLWFVAFQLYCDFSGYSDIAIGIARVLGFNFPLNFRKPYFATNFADHWRRWHISLSDWLRDYLYIPLGGSRAGEWHTRRNLMITMLLGGLWHGASWNFVIWGVLHGLFLIVGRQLRPYRIWARVPLPTAVKTVLQIVILFVMTCFTLIFFRSETLSDALNYLVGIFAFDDLSFNGVKYRFLIVKGIALIVLLEIGEIIDEFVPLGQWVRRNHPAMRAATVATCLWLVALLGTFDANQFVYFQF